MKTRVITGILLTMFLASMLSIWPQFIAAQPPWGMVDYWKFDEGSGITASDSVGVNHGTLYGPVWTTGIVGGALSFDKNYVEIPDSPSIRVTKNLTVEAWVYPYAMTYWEQGNWGYIVVKDCLGSLTEPTVSSYGLFTQMHWAPGFHFQIYTTDGERAIRSDPSLPYPIKWYHLAGTYDGSEMRLYIDGVLQASVSHSGEIIYNSQPLYIGRNAPYRWHDNFFRGKIDEVAIYNRPLTAEEIQQHYQNGLMGLGYYVEKISATIDIDPDTLNLKSNGEFVTAYIELPSGHNVADIDLNTVQLEGISAITDPKYSFVTDPSQYLVDHDGDGIMERMVKFDRTLVRDALTDLGLQV